MTVTELIKHLEQFDGNLLVARADHFGSAIFYEKQNIKTTVSGPLVWDHPASKGFQYLEINPPDIGEDPD